MLSLISLYGVTDAYGAFFQLPIRIRPYIIRCVFSLSPRLYADGRMRIRTVRIPYDTHTPETLVESKVGHEFGNLS